MDKMAYGTGCWVKMSLVGEVAGAGEVDIAHTQADSCLMSSDPPDRVLEEVGQVDIEHKALQAYHTVHSSQQRWDRRGRSVAAAAGHTDRNQLRRSVAVDIEHSAADNGRIDVVGEAGVVGAEAEAMMTGTARDMVVEVDVEDDVEDALTGEGALGSDEGGVDVGADGGQVPEGDVEAEAVART